jgi:hypothetical protein
VRLARGWGNAVNYFVAEDVVHIRSREVAGFVSACGWDYEPIAVEWADDYEPEAWAACEDCMAGQEPSEVSREVVTVQGVYALDDDAHLLTGREGGSWLSLCGRIDSNETVDWAGHEWPEAYEECPECAAMVHPDLWDPDATDRHRESRQVEPSSFVKRVREYRLWIVAQDGFEHRPSDATLAKAMCGVALASNNEQRSAPMGGPTHCHACDRAVGQARTAARPRREPKQKRPSARPPKRAAQQTNAPARKPSSASATKEIALYGRRMIVPVRFVRGGSPGLGRRR